MRATTITITGLALCALFGLGLPSYAEEAAPEGPAFNYQTGNITLPNKVATLHLAGNYRYLDPAETEKLLVAWGATSPATTRRARSCPPKWIRWTARAGQSS